MGLNIKKSLNKPLIAAINIIFVACIGVLVYVVMQIFVFASFSIPSDSMQPTLKPGDKVVVIKPPTGARILNVFKAAEGLPVVIRRLPGWRSFKRGDVLVFNFVHENSWDSISFNWKQYYIKRCLAVAGDTLNIRNFQYYLNSNPIEGKYHAESEFRLTYPDDSTARKLKLRGYMVDVADSIDCWTIRDFGPVIIPGKGMTLPMTVSNIRRYRTIIEWETGEKISMGDTVLVIGDNRIDYYTFRENYYFMAGDNNVNSMDSRYWGLVPESFIVGKAYFVWWSEDNNEIKWDRILKNID